MTFIKAGEHITFCGKCGAQLTAGTQFCESCGQPARGANVANASAVSASSAAGATTGQAVAAGTVVPAATSAPMASNVAGLVAYVLGFITGIFMLVSEPYKSDKFVRFHALQSIFVSGVYLLVIIGWSLLSSMFLTVGFGAMWRIVFLGWWVVRLAFFALWLFLMYKAYNNERFALPIIGPIAKKHAGL
jgi:uncharacterized membrane protein